MTLLLDSVAKQTSSSRDAATAAMAAVVVLLLTPGSTAGTGDPLLVQTLDVNSEILVKGSNLSNG